MSFVQIKDRIVHQIIKMAKHNETGKLGESLARAWLEKNDYEIKAVNWRHGHHEIDLIAAKGNVLHFFEVKTRRSMQFGYPEEKVGKTKMRSLLSAGSAYLCRNRGHRWVRYNILSISLDSADQPAFFLIEDVY